MITSSLFLLAIVAILAIAFRLWRRDCAANLTLKYQHRWARAAAQRDFEREIERSQASGSTGS
jgi:hypothetical protein